MYVTDMIWLIDALAELRKLGLFSRATPTDAARLQAARELAEDEELWKQVPSEIADVPAGEARRVFRHLGSQPLPE